MLPDPVQYAVSENQAQDQNTGAEVELKAVREEYPAAEEYPVLIEPDEESESVVDTSGPDLPPIDENKPEPTDADPAFGREKQEDDDTDPDSETDKPQPSAPVPEPVITVSPADGPEPTETPKPKRTPSPTPKPTRTPKPTPDQDSDTVPVTVREETPSPEIELNPVATPTATPAAPSPTPAPTAEPSTVSEYELAARVAFFESGSEEGRMAVLSVIYNRCNSSAFGGGKTDIRTEVYRKNQFSVVKKDDFLTASVPPSLIEAAKRVFTQGASVLPENVVFFRVASKGTEWGDKIYYDTIGGNCFFASAG